MLAAAEPGYVVEHGVRPREVLEGVVHSPLCLTLSCGGEGLGDHPRHRIIRSSELVGGSATLATGRTGAAASVLTAFSPSFD